jgi:hypothetical protein
MIRRLVLAGAVLALAAALTTAAMASDHQKTGKISHHAGRSHAAVRGQESWYAGGESPGYQGGFISLGPLGFTAACGAYPQKHGYCGPRYGAPIDAWSY